MKRILEDIKTGQFKHVYLLYGEETYLLRQYLGKLRDALADPEDTVNTSRFEGGGIDPGEIIDLAETMPFFAERRCIFVDDSGFFKKGGEALADYVAEIPESTYLIFSEKEVDRRSRLFKQVDKAGRTVEFARQTEKVLIKWIIGRMKREGRQMTRPVAELLLSRTGNDMNLINCELEKLLCYTMGRDSVERDDVEAICVMQLSDRIYDMVDAVAGKQRERALELYYDLLMRRETSMHILFLITRQFRTLMQLKEMGDQGCSEQSMAAQTKIPGFAVRKNLRQAARFTEDQLLDAVEGGVQTEEDIKSGKMVDRIAVEMYLIKYST